MTQTLLRQLGADGWEYNLVDIGGGGGGGGAPSGPAGGFLTGTYPDPDPPAWWTVDSTPGAEVVEFAGQITVNPPNAAPSTTVIGGTDILIQDGTDVYATMGADPTKGAFIELYGSGSYPRLSIYEDYDGTVPLLIVSPTGAVTISPSSDVNPLDVILKAGGNHRIYFETEEGAAARWQNVGGELLFEHRNVDGDTVYSRDPTGAVTISPSEGPVIDAEFYTHGPVSVISPATDDGFGSLLYGGYDLRNDDDQFLAKVGRTAYPDAPYEYDYGWFSGVKRSTADGHVLGTMYATPSYISVDDYDYDTSAYVVGDASMEPGRIRVRSAHAGDASLQIASQNGSKRYLGVMGNGAPMIGTPEGVADHLSGAKDGQLVATEGFILLNPDDTNPALVIRAKTTDGTIATATIPMTPA